MDMFIRKECTLSILNRLPLVMLAVVLVSGTLVPVHAIPPIERAWSSVPIFKDQSGRELVQVGADELVVVESIITSTQKMSQSFAYILQIKDDKEITLQLSWLDGELGPLQEFKASQSWVPHEEGLYLIERFIWSSVSDPDPLGPVQGEEIVVQSTSKAVEFDFAIFADPESLIIQKGKSAEVAITVEPIGEDIRNVRLLSDNTHNGITVSSEQDSRGNRPPYSVPVTIAVSDSATLGTHVLDIVGETESGATQHSATIMIMVVSGSSG
jgi:hypothetical protein